MMGPGDHQHQQQGYPMAADHQQQQQWQQEAQYYQQYEANQGVETPFMPPMEKAACLIGGAVLLFVSFLHMIDIPMLWEDFFKYISFWYLAAIGAV